MRVRKQDMPVPKPRKAGEGLPKTDGGLPRADRGLFRAGEGRRKDIADRRKALIAFLKEVGAGGHAHTGRSLTRHLLGTYDLLAQWNCEESICVAGGLHSIYGTNVFTARSVTGRSRPLVRRLFGADAERLAWLFGTLDRPGAIERGRGIDVRKKVAVRLTAGDVRALRLIEAANLLEQGESLEGWPNIMKEMKRACRVP